MATPDPSLARRVDDDHPILHGSAPEVSTRGRSRRVRDFTLLMYIGTEVQMDFRLLQTMIDTVEQVARRLGLGAWRMEASPPEAAWFVRLPASFDDLKKVIASAIDGRIPWLLASENRIHFSDWDADDAAILESAFRQYQSAKVSGDDERSE